ncbi:MAG: hypothetical protein ABEJ05_00100 [Haloglomus sp.]
MSDEGDQATDDAMVDDTGTDDARADDTAADNDRADDTAADNADSEGDDASAAEDVDEVRTWLVERSYDSRDLITLVYATPDGERALMRELSSSMLDRTPITAARDVDPGDLAPVDESDRERYRAEAERVRENNDPDEEI